MGEFAEWEKFTNFELAARVPLFIKAPWLAGSIAGRVSRALTELIDVMPSIIELVDPAGVVPPGVEGSSLAPQLVPAAGQVGDGAPGKTAALTQFPRCVQPGLPMWKGNDCDDVPRGDFTHMGLSVRTERWRFTRWLLWDGENLRPAWDEPDAGTELYDHAGDDGLSLDGGFEAVNVATSHPGVVAALNVQLRKLYPDVKTATEPPLNDR